MGGWCPISEIAIGWNPKGWQRQELLVENNCDLTVKTVDTDFG